MEHTLFQNINLVTKSNSFEDNFIYSFSGPVEKPLDLTVYEPISIRYNLKYLVEYGKIAKPRGNGTFVKEISKNSAENEVFHMEIPLYYHFTLNAFKIAIK